MSFLRAVCLAADYDTPTPAPGDVVYVAMSSGVDSSYVAHLMASRHADVRGIYMVNWTPSLIAPGYGARPAERAEQRAAGKQPDCVDSEWATVQAVADQIGIPCERVNFEREYWLDVFEPMVDGFRAGETPNPDVGCNRTIKFGRLLDHLAARHAADGRRWWLATGHYAGISRHSSGHLHLLRPRDTKKDQSFYLATVRPDAYGRMLLPLAETTKNEVRALAKAAGLVTADKRDSQGLCFVGTFRPPAKDLPGVSRRSPARAGRAFRDFLAEFIPDNPGNIVTADGRVVGRHRGLWHATIGQRSGVCMPQADPATAGVWFVAAKDRVRNEVVIVRGSDNPALFSAGARVRDFHWTVLPAERESVLAGAVPLEIQVKSLEHDRAAAVDLTEAPAGLTMRFSRPLRAVAPGQNLVLYAGDRVLGAGVIDAAEPVDI
ncbi:tRNA-specific 2-thiouridylase [Dipodascopsis tothii]|uniref:tRNA-specific 2-thiouridylase n=1 Tax=Dipodascopsis tothii TaxID=44089 RepID=UPI0034CDD7BE